MPPNMFVTCLYILIDPASGLCLSANAGHNLPILSRKGWAEEIRVRGMPLGLISGMTYEEREVVIKPGESLLLYSDGLVEAHNPEGAMFESPRLIDLLKSGVRGSKQIQVSLKELAQFVGQDWEQEDDVTLVSLERLGEDLDMQHNMDLDDQMIKLAEFEVESIPGNEREVMNRVAEIVSPLGFSAERLEQLKTAVAETTMNAMEHGNQYREDLKVRIQIFKDVPMLVIRVRDHGGGKQIPDHVLPDLDAKIAGLQPPRGWGIFLIENMVDEMKVFSNDEYHTVELRMKLWE
jgi:anti-sigma regulatory factor (Ser/Thr protein kinase)